MPHTSLTALSPLDGRYAEKLNALRPLCSEFGLIYFRVKIEIAWLIILSQQENIPEVPQLDDTGLSTLHEIINNFNETDAEAIKTLEQTTNHDVKAVEYFIKTHLQKIASLKHLTEFVHFGCTSEDINNIAYALMLQTVRKAILIPLLQTTILKLRQLAHEFADYSMLSRTHGQPASPTTMGKELANFVARLEKQLERLETIPFYGKTNGAVGNFNAHVVAYPDVDWLSVSQQFIEGLGLSFQAHTTQIEAHDYMAEFFHSIIRINTILLDLSRDMWGYISLDYFNQKKEEQEIGSSTMPHKINPIDFENAEGNLGIANALLDHLALKLPISRWQRDLSDSTTLRNIGVAIGHGVLAYDALQKGLSKARINTLKLESDLNDHWEVLGEAIQTVMRRYGLENPYERLKSFSRGKLIDKAIIDEFINELALPSEEKERLKKLTPKDYIGLAAKLAKDI